jgi:hypothetical protein
LPPHQSLSSHYTRNECPKSMMMTSKPHAARKGSALRIDTRVTEISRDGDLEKRCPVLHSGHLRGLNFHSHRPSFRNVEGLHHRPTMQAAYSKPFRYWTPVSLTLFCRMPGFGNSDVIVRDSAPFQMDRRGKPWQERIHIIRWRDNSSLMAGTSDSRFVIWNRLCSSPIK